MPELKSGDVLVSPAGRKMIVRRIKSKRRVEFDEPIYRLIHLLDDGRQLTGNAEWTLDELAAAGARMA